MSEYDIDKLNSPIQEDTITNVPNEVEKKPNYLMAFLAGFGASVIVGIVIALIGMWTESEYMIVLCIGAVIVASVIKHFVPRKAIGGAIIGAILTPATYFIYQTMMAFNGYYYEKDGDTWFWFLLIGSVILGGFMGYNNDDE
jgi:hypothetical protein